MGAALLRMSTLNNIRYATYMHVLCSAADSGSSRNSGMQYFLASYCDP